MGMSERIATAILRAFAAFAITGIIGCAGLTFLVRNSHDGQAGMGAFFGGLYAACLALVITLIVSFVRSSPHRKQD
jgi:hypothetical protein